MEASLIKTKPLSGMAIKWIAIVSMIIDHFGSIIMDGVLAPYRVDGIIFFTPDMPFMVFNAPLIKSACEILGSVAFPLFCFLIAEGFIHTGNRLKYGLRMALFALISEIPYNIAHYQQLFEPKLQNVMFTLAVSIFTLLLISLAEQRYADNARRRWLLISLSVLAGMGAAFLLRGEYVFLGVAAISLFYVLRGQGLWRLAGIAPLLAVSPWVLLALIPIFLYNGARGRGGKYFFYIFYPSHFLLFAAIAWLISR